MEQSDYCGDSHLSRPRRIVWRPCGDVGACAAGRQVALKLGTAFETDDAKHMMHEDTLAGHYQVTWKARCAVLQLAYLLQN